MRNTMLIRLRPTSLFAALLCLPLGTLLAQQDRIAAQIENGRTVRLTGRVHPQATPRTDRGPVEDLLPGFRITLLR